jgi:hypothetical protein
VPSVSNKLITDIIFSVYRTPLTLKLYILIIVATAISRLTAYHNHKDGLIALLIIKYTRVAAFGLYRS